MIGMINSRLVADLNCNHTGVNADKSNSARRAESMSDTLQLLLRTKLYVLTVPTYLVSRPRLMNQLDEGIGKKLILLSALASYGKTTLLSACVEETLYSE